MFAMEKKKEKNKFVLRRNLARANFRRRPIGPLFGSKISAFFLTYSHLAENLWPEDFGLIGLNSSAQREGRGGHIGEIVASNSP